MEQNTTLAPAHYIDSNVPAVIEYAKEAIKGQTGALDKAIALYYQIRDGIHYTPYVDFSDPEVYRASSVLAAGQGFCVSKASLLAAAGRAVGIPSRVGFADVQNHLNTERLRKYNGGDIMHWHAFAEFYLNDQWVKCTPAFSLDLCTKFRIRPLEFDGINDSIFHPFTEDEEKHMEYVNERGSYDDVPYDSIIATLKEVSPLLLSGPGILAGDFGAEGAAEAAKAQG